MATFTSLPSELIDKIAKLATRANLILLLNVKNRRIYYICRPYLYRHVKISTFSALVAFCDLVVANPDLGARTKSFQHIGILPSEARATCATAIQSLRSLRYLKLARSVSILGLFPPGATVFPLLRTLTSYFSEEIPAFLRAHPHIHELVVSSCPSASIPPIQLTSLELFSGAAALAGAVIPGSQVRRPTIYWGGNADEHQCLAVLSGVEALNNVVNSWHCLRPSEIATHLGPRLINLRFKNIESKGVTDGLQEFFVGLTDALPRFERLKTLTVMQPSCRKFRCAQSYQSEWSLVEFWAILCPTLEEVELMSRMRCKKESGHWSVVGV
ncbi:hypothetical protein FB45DRAFT_1000060 [Roridomyces roridus]|uniref:F-box domain-containing protein n=1 Tax=Roridomyces roridus TaxID=1738132 RepID=A0AAD7C7L0_9AGAR|nr:hypothetical protein FB45DRAFT_1000060 [Roridomyces roridus]